MAYFNNILIQTSDSPSIDAFARWRISEIETLFDSKQVYDRGTLQWNDVIIGNATSSHEPLKASRFLVASGSNSRVLRQSRRRFNYQTGKSHFVITTTNFGNHPRDNVIERVGYYDDFNGMFFSQSGSLFGVVSRNNGTDTFISQSSWNIDKFDGNGPSGKILNISASQIYFWDFEWLGVGRIRYGIFQGGTPYYVHQITNINALPDTAPVYMSNPNLPIRYEIINSGSVPAYMYHICATVGSEGGHTRLGQVRSADIPGNGGTVTISAGTYAALLAIRLHSGSLNTAINPLGFNISNQGGNNNFKWAILLNPTIGAAFNWISIPSSSIEYASGSTNHTITNEGYKIYSGYISSTIDQENIPFDRSLGLGSTGDNVADIMVIGIYNFGTNTTFVGSMTWQETI